MMMSLSQHALQLRTIRHLIKLMNIKGDSILLQHAQCLHTAKCAILHMLAMGSHSSSIATHPSKEGAEYAPGDPASNMSS